MLLVTGTILDRAPGRTYAKTLRFAELSLRAPLPRPATLTSWRKDLPKDFALALRAPKDALVSPRGPLRFDAAMESSLAWLLDAANALSVRAVVLPTPADLAPGARARELLTAYVARLPKVEGRHYVWAPRGVWEPEDADPICKELGLVRAFDPLQSPRPPGEIVYAELRALGHRKSFSQAALEDALAVIAREDFREAYVCVDSDRGFDVAKRMLGILAALGADPVDEDEDEEREAPDDDESEDDADDLDEEGEDGDEEGDEDEDEDEDDGEDEDDEDDDE